MFARFFVDRPVFSTVISVVIVIVGLVALVMLPIAQYPEIAPPTITVTASYPGANAKVVADTVATPIEQEVNGVENMLYMSSRSSNDGQMTLDITFKLGTNLDMAQVLVQNRVAIAQAKLPDEVKRQGVTTKKKSPSILLRKVIPQPLSTTVCRLCCKWRGAGFVSESCRGPIKANVYLAKGREVQSLTALLASL